MRISPLESGAAGATAPGATVIDDPVRALFEVLPRPIRFLGVGGLGLVTDLAVFTLSSPTDRIRSWRGWCRSPWRRW